MANGEKELEVRKKDLTLDQPPASSSPTPLSLPEHVNKPPLPLDSDNQKEETECLSVNNDDLIAKLKTDEENEHTQQQEPDDSSRQQIVLKDKVIPLPVDDGLESSKVGENYYAPEPSIESKPKGTRKEKRLHFHGKPLLSCLKVKVQVRSVENSNIDRVQRNVHFPQDNDYVKEFIDPVDPWRDVRTPSKNEVISFYRNSCHKQRTKPLDKVIKQIQDVTDLSQRASGLVLRGSRLDNRSCEALESVFRRMQFESLDLENCSLEEDGATAVLEMVEFYHSACKLNISCNPKIGMRGWHTLCRMLRKTPCLTYLDARRTLLTDMTMPTFGRCLKADPPLKILHLEGVFLSGRPMLILTTAMKYNKILEELYLGDNDLSSSDGSPIGAMLTYNTTLQLLDLRNNQIKDVGLAHICNGLSDQAEQHYGGLCSLILWNNGLTHEGMTYLNEGLMHTSSLKALNLGHNRIGDLGIQKLKIGLIKNKSLHKCGFLNTKLGSEGAVALAEVLADSLSITRIDIRENNIQTAGLMAFSMALKVNHSLLRLDLDKDIRKEPGMEQVMQTVLVDIYNYCHRNKHIARQSLQSSVSSTASLCMTRQTSTESSDLNDGHILFDDVFHPEEIKQQIMPFSPVYTDQSQLELKYPLVFNPGKHQQTTKPSSDINTTKTEAEPQIPQPATKKELIAAISSSPPTVPLGGHILNKPPLNSSERRSSNRFSVTKILDSLGTHAAGVANKIASAANMESKLKKQTPKDDLKKVVEIENKQTEEDVKLMKDLSAEIHPQTKATNPDLQTDTVVTSRPSNGTLNSPIEIIDVIDLQKYRTTNSEEPEMGRSNNDMDSEEPSNNTGIAEPVDSQESEKIVSLEPKVNDSETSKDDSNSKGNERNDVLRLETAAVNDSSPETTERLLNDDSKKDLDANKNMEEEQINPNVSSSTECVENTAVLVNDPTGILVQDDVECLPQPSSNNEDLHNRMLTLNQPITVDLPS